MNNPDREYDEHAEQQIVDEMNEHDARTEKLIDRADHLRTERKDQAWEDAMEAKGEAQEEERKQQKNQS